MRRQNNLRQMLQCLYHKCNFTRKSLKRIQVRLRERSFKKAKLSVRVLKRDVGFKNENADVKNLFESFELWKGYSMTFEERVKINDLSPIS